MLRIKNWLGLQSIRHKLMIAAIACILIPAALTQLIYTSLTQDAVQRQAISNAQDSMLLVDASVTNLLKSMLNIANYIQVNSDMNTYFKLVASGNTEKDDAYRKFTDKNRIIQQLDSLTVSEKSYVTILLTDGTAFTNYSTSDYNPLSLLDEPWFKELGSYNGLSSYWVGTSPTVFPYMSQDNPYQLSLARTLRRDDQRIYGYVVVTVMENRVNQLFKSLPSNQEVMLLDADNRILSSGDAKKIGTVFTDSGTKTGRLNTSIEKAGNTKYLVTEKPFSFNEWRLVSKQRYSEAIVDISSIFNRVFVVQFSSLVIFLLLLLALLRAFTKPFVLLGRTTSAVQRGNLSVRSGIRGRDEIGRLGFLFDQMLDRIQEMIAEVSDTQARKRKAELKMLQAQIHPHFLFNVLNSIRMKVMRRGDPESAKMIGSLSTLLRMTINREEDEIYLHEELELLTHYVELMNLRQKEEVRVSMEIASEAMLVRVPRFFLQPIVENALIHGFSQKAGLIRIQADMKERLLTLTVEDNGIGMDRQALEALNRKLIAPGNYSGTLAEAGAGSATSANAGAAAAFSGLGLVNVAERMRLLRGERFTMKVESAPGEGTLIRLIIAYERADGDV
ncbi:sensor histidine kinase [Cohnella lupini]|uniref:Two-component system sensor histidine kinase YesM n=1 Tax=Cohnella lupini TaxID=1294267 RepID=A0A3D9INF1_9BACL|nr:histidine kinase [Cohnella lupini]RED63217.1 two-component system sensor histidine kinase YesM [Cohnella lupini]